MAGAEAADATPAEEAEGGDADAARGLVRFRGPQIAYRALNLLEVAAFERGLTAQDGRDAPFYYGGGGGARGKKRLLVELSGKDERELSSLVHHDLALISSLIGAIDVDATHVCRACHRAALAASSRARRRAR